jgi:hypothetical protein
MTDQPDVDLVAASLRADTTDLAIFVDVLASKLEAALPGLATVRRSGGLFSKRRSVDNIVVALGEQRFTLSCRGGGLAAEVEHLVRGVRLSGEPVDLDTWLQRFSQALTKYAETERRGREALAKLLG